MTDFDYTHSTTPDSSLVQKVLYNANTKELVVNLRGWGYKYSDVEQSDYHNLISADSVGSAYTDVKREHGPAEPLGQFNYVNTNVVWVRPTNTTVGTPKDLKVSDDTIVTTATAPATQVFNLYSNEPQVSVSSEPTVRRFHKVVFDVDGGATGKSYSTEAGSVDEAVKSLTDVVDSLGLEVTVREVTVYFE